MVFARTAAATAPITLADLRRLLDDKEQALRALLTTKERIAGELEQLGATIEAMLRGGAVAPGRSAAIRAAAKPVSAATKGAAKRGGNTKGAGAARGKWKGKGKRAKAPIAPGTREGSLTACIRAVLERVVGPMRVSEIGDAVIAAGYESSSKNLKIIVANRLSQMEDVEKVERGLYQLKRESSATAAAQAASAAG